MASRSIPSRVVHRVINNFLLIGLACVWVCLVAAFSIAWRGDLEVYAPVVAIAPLAVLLVGCVVIRSHLRLSAEIEAQLVAVASDGKSSVNVLKPVSGRNSVAVGWNQLIEQTSKHSTMSQLESRLNATMSTLRAQRSQEILDGLPDGIAVTGPDGVIDVANRALSALLGEECDSPTSMEDMLRVESSPEFENIIEQLGHISRPITFELPVSDDANEGVLRVGRYPVTDSHDGSVQHVWTVRDVTQAKLAEQARNQFVSTATHELRTPLANIRVLGETLLSADDIDVEQQKSFCNTINQEAARLARFVDELLNVDKMAAGEMSLDKRNTELLRLMDEVCEHAEPQMKQKQIDFVRRLPPKLPELRIDKDKVSGALVNLLGNAAKYTPEGGQVSFEVKATSNGIEFHVEDTGIGISATELPKVFDKFFRSEDERVRDVIGSGLGLAFSREVARLHGGSLAVHSELDHGSKFTMTLPHES